MENSALRRQGGHGGILEGGPSACRVPEAQAEQQAADRECHKRREDHEPLIELDDRAVMKGGGHIHLTGRDAGFFQVCGRELGRFAMTRS